MRHFLLEILADALLIGFGIFFLWQFSITAYRGMFVWDSRPWAILEAVVALGLVILGAERLIRDLKNVKP